MSLNPTSNGSLLGVGPTPRHGSGEPLLGLTETGAAHLLQAASVSESCRCDNRTETCPECLERIEAESSALVRMLDEQAGTPRGIERVYVRGLS